MPSTSQRHLSCMRLPRIVRTPGGAMRPHNSDCHWLGKMGRWLAARWNATHARARRQRRSWRHGAREERVGPGWLRCCFARTAHVVVERAIPSKAARDPVRFPWRKAFHLCTSPSSNQPSRLVLLQAVSGESHSPAGRFTILATHKLTQSVPPPKQPTSTSAGYPSKLSPG